MHYILGFGVGAKIPLGSTIEKSDKGIVLNANLQSGSGAWDIVYWRSVLKSMNFRPSLGVSTKVSYRSTA